MPKTMQKSCQEIGSSQLRCLILLPPCGAYTKDTCVDILFSQQSDVKTRFSDVVSSLCQGTNSSSAEKVMDRITLRVKDGEAGVKRSFS